MEYFIKTFEDTIKRCWDKPALDEFKVSSITYGQLAADLETIMLYFKAAGLKRGDKVALNARSSDEWAKIFMASIAGGYVAVQLFNGYTPSDTQKLTNHSDSRILFTESAIFNKMDFDEMPNLLGVIEMKNGELLASRNGFDAIYYSRKELFAKAHPNGMKPEDVHFIDRDMDEICGINYTSGSTGNPKGVMLTVRNFSANVALLPNHFSYIEGDSYVSILPYAHIFGLTFDMITPLCRGLHLVVLGIPPVPANLKAALLMYNPRIFIAVPLVITKMIENTIGEFVNSKSGRAKLEDYENNPDFCKALCTIFMSAFGSNIEVIITGGAAIPEHIEDLLVAKLKAPFVTGYGMTECAPTISLGHYGTYKQKSCGEYVSEAITAKIDSDDPEHIPGEIMVKGDVVFEGYYKNPEATNAVLTDDGWFHTGDLATMDKDHTIFIVGRKKSMLLTSSGQNIYPEEIEVVLNAMRYVQESLIVNRGEKLIALIVLNQDMLAEDGIGKESLNEIMHGTINALNNKIPAYSTINGFEIKDAPFVKTPKGSIKRFMYA
ncbi:MAG: AMP-binding protein [Bacteroidales bacterium]|nr:AMP-binding protein [Bacteroidales bacterium]